MTEATLTYLLLLAGTGVIAYSLLAIARFQANSTKGGEDNKPLKDKEEVSVRLEQNSGSARHRDTASVRVAASPAENQLEAFNRERKI